MRRGLVVALLAFTVRIGEGRASADDATTLAIPDRDQAPESPPSGWCGETAIQEALLHYGVWASQRRIHEAGKSKHPDLYSEDIPRALDALGVRYERFVPKKQGFSAFAGFVRDALERSAPVFAGVKILPTEHPEWGLDHFVLAVGHGPKGLLVNTTWGKQVWASDTTKKGISFAGAFFAFAILGVQEVNDTWSPRLSVVKESPTQVELRVRCGLPVTSLERADQAAGKATWSTPMTTGETTVSVPADTRAYFRCRLTGPG